MAKQPQRTGGVGKVKVRVFEFEMDGSDESIQDTMKTLAAALTSGGHNNAAPRRLKAEASPPLPNGTGESLDDVQLNDAGDEEDVDDVVPRPATDRKPAAPRKPIQVKILPDINFTDVKPTLKEFYDAKKPGKVLSANYLVVAYWYKHHRKIEELTVDHFHTAFRHVGFPTPKNVILTIRELRNSRDGRLMGGEAPNSCKIHHLGENFVDAMPKASD
jgi:hypothetical protein